MRVYKLILLIVLINSCAEDKNYGECTDEKDDISEVNSSEEMIEIEEKKYSSTCTILTYEEDAQSYLNQAAAASTEAEKVEFYSKAAIILEKLVEFYPEEHNRYGVLAASYAGVAGVELIDFLTEFSQSTRDSVFDGEKETLPSPEDASYELAKASLTAAVEWIDQKISLQGLSEPSQADQLQATVYRMAQTFVIANDFLSKTTSGE